MSNSGKKGLPRWMIFIFFIFLFVFVNYTIWWNVNITSPPAGYPMGSTAELGGGNSHYYEVCGYEGSGEDYEDCLRKYSILSGEGKGDWEYLGAGNWGYVENE